MHSTPVTMCTVANPCFGPGSAQPIYLGLIRPISKKKNQKYLFQHFIIFPRSFYVILINIGWYFMLLKIQKSDIKIPGFCQKLPKIQKNWKKRKNVFVHTAKCLKAKRNHIVFFIHQKNNVLACILALITSLLKSRE